MQTVRLGRTGAAAALQPLTAQRERPGRRSTAAPGLALPVWLAVGVQLCGDERCAEDEAAAEHQHCGQLGF